MTFPSTSLLDSFDRGNENPLTSSLWGPKILTTYSVMKLVSNLAVGTAGGTNAMYLLNALLADQEVFCTFNNQADWGSVGLYARLVNPNVASSTNGYLIKSVGTTAIQVQKMVNSVPAAIGSNISQTISNGDSMGLQTIGSTLNTWYKVGAGAWALIDQRTDSTHTAGGFIGMSVVDTVNITANNFGGGNIVKGPPPLFMIGD